MWNYKQIIALHEKWKMLMAISKDGYPHYRRMNDSLTVTKNGVCLDNRSMVPYNRKLLLKYQAHINVD